MSFALQLALHFGLGFNIWIWNYLLELDSKAEITLTLNLYSISIAILDLAWWIILDVNASFAIRHSRRDWTWTSEVDWTLDLHQMQTSSQIQTYFVSSVSILGWTLDWYSIQVKIQILVQIWIKDTNLKLGHHTQTLNLKFWQTTFDLYIEH